MKQSLYEQNGGTYREENGHLIPNLTLPENNKQPIGKYGLIHLDYLKKHRRGTYTTLLTEGTLNSYLVDIDHQARDMIGYMIDFLKEEKVITEDMKANNQLEWVQTMNTLKAEAEEIIIETILLR